MKERLGKISMVTMVFILMGLFITLGSATAGEIGRDDRFIAYDNDTVLDTGTNLMWAAQDNFKVISWEDAKTFCETYQGGGYSDWRMPRLEELSKLHDRTTKSLTEGKIPVYLTKLIKLSSVGIWAVETRGSSARTVLFISDIPLAGWEKKSDSTIVRALPVRSVK